MVSCVHNCSFSASLWHHILWDFCIRWSTALGWSTFSRATGLEPHQRWLSNSRNSICTYIHSSSKNYISNETNFHFWNFPFHRMNQLNQQRKLISIQALTTVPLVTYRTIHLHQVPHRWLKKPFNLKLVMFTCMEHLMIDHIKSILSTLMENHENLFSFSLINKKRVLFNCY